MERQQALAEAVVRQVDTHEAIASGRFGAGGLLSRGRGRLSHRSQAEQTAGVSQVLGCMCIIYACLKVSLSTAAVDRVCAGNVLIEWMIFYVCGT